jgi:NCAIR mutase (PurE)-related protein
MDRLTARANGPALSIIAADTTPLPIASERGANAKQRDVLSRQFRDALCQGVTGINSAISQLQRRFDQLSDSEALVVLRADPGVLTPGTLKRFAQRLATLAKLWQRQ